MIENYTCCLHPVNRYSGGCKCTNESMIEKKMKEKERIERRKERGKEKEEGIK